VVAPEVEPALAELADAGKIVLARRSFDAADLVGAWFVVAAATPDVNRGVAAAAESQRLFVLAVDDPSAASAYGAGALRRGGVTVAISTDGRAPALAGLLREGLDAVLPEDLDAWTAEAEKQRAAWRAAKVPMAERRPLLLRALNRIYEATARRRASARATWSSWARARAAPI
jgi:uroporphyrin-III C-methyltransferase/precorrin-2 dehydrogenase/sirohydrochlorin ferrochelatase